jgi:diguanylate cyclase (GGDEF)-like protein
MYDLFYLVAAIEVVVGISLLFAWKRDKKQGFVRKIGLSFFGVAASVTTFALFADAPVESPINLVVIPTLACLSIYFLVAGVVDLIGYQLTKTASLLFAGSLLLFMLIVAARTESVSSQLGVAVIYLVVGLLATKALNGKSTAHRLIGPLLILLALHPLISVSGSEESIAWQFAIGAVLRTVFGFVALYVALDLVATETLELNERFARLTEHSVQGVAVLNDSALLYANSATLKIYGTQSDAELKQLFLNATAYQEQNSPFWCHYQQLMSDTTDHVSWDGKGTRPDGSVRDLRFFAYRVTWDNHKAICVLISDETERMASDRAVLHRATHDALTDLPNRGLLMQQLQQLYSGHAPKMRFYLYLLNIDRFKLFNSAYGFSLGDEVLKSLAAALTATIANRGTLFHVGIDEFAILFSADSMLGSMADNEQDLMTTLTHPLKVSSGEFYIDVSIGRAVYPENGNSAEEIVRACNAAMHIAKAKPGTHLVHAELNYEHGFSELLTLEQALRGGIKRREFYLCYQPKVEALARWERPGVGMVSPQLFIKAAETTGLIVELGTLLLRSACQQIAQWQEEGIACVPVAVNVSPIQLLNSQFPMIVVEALAEFSVPAHLLTLEITESAAVESLEHTQSQLWKLRELGISIAMDDFGSGFSSLSMLRQLPLNAVKIDKALIDPLPSVEGAAVVRAICQLSAALGLKVVAEGVETQQQATAAVAAGCDEFQGYFFGKPLNLADARALLLAKNAIAG